MKPYLDGIVMKKEAVNTKIQGYLKKQFFSELMPIFFEVDVKETNFKHLYNVNKSALFIYNEN